MRQLTNNLATLISDIVRLRVIDLAGFTLNLEGDALLSDLHHGRS